jgi:polar amino acid transport system substrate-binding protein
MRQSHLDPHILFPCAARRNVKKNSKQEGYQFPRKVFHLLGYILPLFSVLFVVLSNKTTTAVEIVADTPRFETFVIATPTWENQVNADGTGLFFDLLHAVYDPLGITLQVSFAPIKRSCKMLQKKEIDASVGFYSDEVGKKIGWDFYQTPKHPIITENFCAVFKKGKNINWRYPESLSNTRVCWIEGYDLKDRIPVSMSYQKAATQKQAWNLLKTDRIDYYVDAASDSRSAAKQDNIDLNEYQFGSMWTDKMYIPFALTDRGAYFMSVFDLRMAQLHENGQLAQIYSKWNVPLPPKE